MHSSDIERRGSVNSEEEPSDAQQHYSVASHFLAEENYTEAWNFLERALEADPSFIDAYGDLRFISRVTDDPSRFDSISLLAKLANNESNAERVTAKYQLALCLIDRNQPERALLQLESIVENSDWDHVGAMLKLSSLYIKLERYERAIQLVNKVIEFFPELSEARYLKALALYHTNNFEEALEMACELLTEANGEFVEEACVVLSLCHSSENYSKQNLNRALEMAERAIEEHAECLEAHLQKARIYFLLRDFENVVKTIEPLKEMSIRIPEAEESLYEKAKEHLSSFQPLE